MSIRSKEVVPPMPVESEQDPYMRSDQERVVEEIRRLFERYRETARHATEDAEHRRRAEAPHESSALTLR
jgi:hypothetical protein